MLRGSLPGATVSFARILPSRPLMLTSPPPWLPTMVLARSMACAWVSV